MAIKKQIELKTGGFAEYWRIESFLAYNGDSTVKCNVSLWKDRATRLEADKEPISLTSYSVDIDELSGEILVKIYDAIKQLPAFQGAEDV